MEVGFAGKIIEENRLMMSKPCSSTGGYVDEFLRNGLILNLTTFSGDLDMYT